MHWKIPGIMAALLLSLLSAVLYYRHQYQQAEKARKQAVLDIVQHQKVFEQMSQQIKTVSQLDAQHTRTLKNDENQPAQLERDLADGRRRLHLQAPYSPMPSAAPAPSVDDATHPPTY